MKYSNKYFLICCSINFSAYFLFRLSPEVRQWLYGVLWGLSNTCRRKCYNLWQLEKGADFNLIRDTFFITNMGSKPVAMSDNLLRIPFTRYAIITVSLPAFSLAYCFFSAYFFRLSEINDTDCNVSTFSDCFYSWKKYFFLVPIVWLCENMMQKCFRFFAQKWVWHG